MQEHGIKTPLGTALIKTADSAIFHISLNDKPPSNSSNISGELKKCVHQLQTYFKGDLKSFNFRMKLKGTSFQQKVWQALQEIPYGETISYKELAQQIGDANAVRAVASANGKNPLWIAIPCHRVIGSDGNLRGYAGGVWRKKWLLNHEGTLKQKTLF